MELTGRIAQAAQGELPEDWAALKESKNFGPTLLLRKVLSISYSLFNKELDEAEEEALDFRVVDYAGKLVALDLINPAIDYWSKQATTIAATGRNENKTWADRARYLQELREALLFQSRAMYPEVDSLLLTRRGRRAGQIPRVQQINVGVTNDPMSFEPPYGS